MILSSGVYDEPIPHLVFSVELQSNNLSYHQNYSKKQEAIHRLITYLHQEEGLGYRKISRKMNEWGISTQRGNQWLPQSVHSVLKRKSQRDTRVEDIRNKQYPLKIGKFSITYSLLD